MFLVAAALVSTPLWQVQGTFSSVEAVSELEIGAPKLTLPPTVDPDLYFKHLVVDSDSLLSVCRLYRVTLSELASLNGLEPGQFIVPGTVLLIPPRD